MTRFVFLKFESWRRDDWWAGAVVDVKDLKDGIHTLEDALKVIGVLEPSVHKSKVTAFTFNTSDYHHVIRYTGTKPNSSWRHASNGTWWIASESGIRQMILQKAAAIDMEINQQLALLQEDKERIKAFIGKKTFDGFPEEEREEFRTTPVIVQKIQEGMAKFRGIARRSVAIEIHIEQAAKEEKADGDA